MKLRCAIFMLILLSISSFGQTIGNAIDTIYSSPGKILTISYQADSSRIKKHFFDYDGNLATICHFKDTLLDGTFTSITPTSKTITYYKNGLKTGVSNTYSSEGILIFTKNYTNNHLEGFFNEYYSNGKIKIAGKYLQDLRNGDFIHYYQNGKVKYTGAYKDDKMEGERLCYDENGSLCHGKFVTYHENGQKERECICVNGRPNGELKVYNIEGSITMSVSFRNGKPDGLTKYFNGIGVFKTEIYKDGKFEK